MLTKTSTATFTRHYIEMVVVMFAGMIVLGLPGEAALKALGSGTAELRDDAPAVVFLGMAATMTVPMVAWMRYRGHRWQPSLEMAASMIIPTVVAIALLAAEVLRFGALMGSSTSRCRSACSSRCRPPRRVHGHTYDGTRRDRRLSRQRGDREDRSPASAGLLAPPGDEAAVRTAGGSEVRVAAPAISEAMYSASSLTHPRRAEPRVCCQGRPRK